MTQLLLALAPTLPVLLATTCAVPRLAPQAFRLLPWAATPALLLALGGVPGEALDVPWVLLGSRLGLDAVGQVFLLLTAVLWITAGLAATAQVTEPRAPFAAAWLLALAGSTGVVLAEDVLTFYLAFALTSFAGYPLVVHAATASARHAGRVYLSLVVLGEMCLFGGLVLLFDGEADPLLSDVVRDARATGPAGWLLLVGLGVKAGAAPVHVWLPLAHPVAPTPASAILSGAMIKAGVLGWARLLPLGVVAVPEQGLLLVALGLAAAFLAVAAGLAQDDPKVVLAYSSVSQIGLVMVIVGVGLADPAGWRPMVLALYALHHGLAKGAAFLGVGVARGSAWLGLLLPALALAGAPWTSGAVAKASLKAVVEAAPGLWLDLLPLLVSLSGAATTVLMIRFLRLARDRAQEGPEAPLPARLGWAALLLVLASVLWLLPWPELRGTVWSATHVIPTLTDLWPLGLGALLAGAALAFASGGRRLPLHVPPGDLLLPVTRGLSALLLGAARAGSRLDAGRHAIGEAWRAAAVAIATPATGSIDRAEAELRRFRTLGTLFLLLVLALFALAG